MARDAAGKRKLTKQTLDALHILRDGRIELAVGALQIGIRDNSRSTMARAGHEQDVQIALFDETVEVRVNEIQSGYRSPVTKKPRFNMLDSKWNLQQRIVEQVDLTDGKIVGCPPPCIDETKLVVRQRCIRHHVTSGTRTGGKDLSLSGGVKAASRQALVSKRVPARTGVPPAIARVNPACLPAGYGREA